MSGFIDATTGILAQALDGLTTRQADISANLANIDTPGYAPVNIDFETALQAEVANLQRGSADIVPPSTGPSADVAMKTTDARHLGGHPAANEIGTQTSESSSSENLRNDANTVDLETELTGLTETQIKYSAVSRLLTAKFSQLNTVLGGQ